jgi:putative flippase GtrA
MQLHRIPRPLKFLLAGGSAAIVEYFLFVLLLALTEKKYVLLIQAISFSGGFIVSFTCNKLWVFSSGQSGKTYHELGKYAVLATVNLVISGFLLWLLVENLLQNTYVSKLIVMVVIAVWNYFIFQKIIFK